VSVFSYLSDNKRIMAISRHYTRITKQHGQAIDLFSRHFLSVKVNINRHWVLEVRAQKFMKFIGP
jgi:hypothetical protein